MNLIGEHTDHQQGLVLPVAIALRTDVTLEPRADRRVRADSGGRELAEYELGSEAVQGRWVDYVQGVTWALARAGHPFGGCDVHVTSTLPSGAGLASSAALLVATTRAMRDAFGLALDDIAVARIAHDAESGFVGARVGLMDQLTASLGAPGVALYIDLRSLDVVRIPLPAAIELGAIHSGIRHAHASGRYNELRAELDGARERLGVASLRDLTPADAPRWDALPERLARRVRHVVGENERVRAMVAALRESDLPRIAALLAAGHASLRDDLRASLPELDLLVELALAEGAIGARLTGGGFGGSIVLVAPRGQARAIADRAVAAYRRRTGRGRVLIP